MGADGHRLAKRHGAVTIARLFGRGGVSRRDVLGWIATTSAWPRRGRAGDRSISSGRLATSPAWIPRHAADQPVLRPQE